MLDTKKYRKLLVLTILNKVSIVSIVFCVIFKTRVYKSVFSLTWRYVHWLDIMFNTRNKSGISTDIQTQLYLSKYGQWDKSSTEIHLCTLGDVR